MKKILLLIAIILIWIYWGGFSNEMGTLVMSLSAIFLLTKDGKGDGDESKDE